MGINYGIYGGKPHDTYFFILLVSLGDLRRVPLDMIGRASIHNMYVMNTVGPLFPEFLCGNIPLLPRVIWCWISHFVISPLPEYLLSRSSDLAWHNRFGWGGCRSHENSRRTFWKVRQPCILKYFPIVNWNSWYIPCKLLSYVTKINISMPKRI